MTQRDELTPFAVEFVHQSTLNDFQKCPRYGALKHLLHITRKGQRKDALEIGTFLHAWMEQHATGKTKVVRNRRDRMRARVLAEWPADEQADALRAIEDNYDFSEALHTCWLEYYNQSRAARKEGKWGLLGTEVELTARIVGVPKTVKGTLDLFWRAEDGGLWVEDYKTCQGSTGDRAATMSMEFQSVIYPILLCQWAVEHGENPANVRGIIHSIISKPDIRLSGADRDFDLETRVLKSGPNKGQERTEKVYRGEPKMANFVRRCMEWYRGVGDYAVDADAVKLDPRMRRSYTRFPPQAFTWDETERAWRTSAAFAERVRTMQRWARRIRKAELLKRIDLAEWDRVTSNCFKYRSLCEYHTLCTGSWPQTKLTQDFVQVEVLSRA